MCSGPLGNDGGLDVFLHEFGWRFRFIDLEIDPGMDICDDVFFNSVLSEVKAGMYAGILFSPPCSTFSAARSVGACGSPRPLRGADVPDIYGFNDLRGSDKEKVRIGTACALRCVELVRALHASKSQFGSRPWLWEQPAPVAGHPHMFRLPEVQALSALPGVTFTELDQCRFGCDYRKPTIFMGTLQLQPLRCDHPPRWWRVPWSGEAYQAAHPRLRGRQAAVPFDHWLPSMLQDREPSGNFLTRSAAAYPARLNQCLAQAFAAAMRPRQQATGAIIDVDAEDAPPPPATVGAGPPPPASSPRRPKTRGSVGATGQDAKRKAMQIQKSALGEQHFDQEAMQIRKSALGDAHFNPKAMQIQKSAMQIRKSALGEAHFDQEAMQIRKSALGEAHFNGPLEADEITYATRLRGPQAGGRKALHRQQDAECVGGMARTSRCVAALPGNLVAGGRVREVLTTFIRDHPDVVRQCGAAIGSEAPGEVPAESLLDELRRRLASHFGVTDIGPASNYDCTSSIRAELLSAWALRAGDPGAAAASWVVNGAPAGILSEPLLAGVFPLADPAQGELLDPSALDQDVEWFTNYAGVDSDDGVFQQIQEFEAKGFLKGFDTLEACTEYLGETPHLSRFGVVTKVRQGRVKRRVILDVKQSRVKECTAKVHRVPLPRITDVVYDILHMLAELPLDESEALELLVLDFVDAFWNIPLAPAERKYFVGRLRGRYYVFLRAAQGSRNGPLAWAGVVSLVLRLVQAAFFDRGACPLRLNTYVDDPIAVVRGTRSSRQHLVAEFILLLRALGFPLAFIKGQLGPVVDWIGLTVKVERASVVVTISAHRVQELLELTRDGLRCNVVSRKWLQSYAGKANSFASVLVFWRPFLQYLWAALYASVNPSAPQNCI